MNRVSLIGTANCRAKIRPDPNKKFVEPGHLEFAMQPMMRACWNWMMGIGWIGMVLGLALLVLLVVLLVVAIQRRSRPPS